MKSITLKFISEHKNLLTDKICFSVNGSEKTLTCQQREKDYAAISYFSFNFSQKFDKLQLVGILSFIERAKNSLSSLVEKLHFKSGDFNLLELSLDEENKEKAIFFDFYPENKIMMLEEKHFDKALIFFRLALLTLDKKPTEEDYYHLLEQF